MPKTKQLTIAERLGWQDTDALIVDLNRISVQLHAADDKIYKIDDTRTTDIIADLESLAKIATDRAEILKKTLHPLLYKD